ncbi:MAG: hypothetical protein FWD45_00770 [Coriobacteriia bacterium]|nr:hypothetical protein [Coriobacteriia bacterium]
MAQIDVWALNAEGFSAKTLKVCLERLVLSLRIGQPLLFETSKVGSSHSTLPFAASHPKPNRQSVPFFRLFLPTVSLRG